MVRGRYLWLLVWLLALSLAGCNSGQPVVTEAPPIETGAPSQSNAAPAEAVPDNFYPKGVRTDIPAVDQVLEAVDSGNPDDLFALVQFTSIPCSTNVQDYAPWCKENQPEGSETAVFMLGGCRAMWEFETGAVLDKFRTMLTPPHTVYAVYRMEQRLSDRTSTTTVVALAQGGDGESVIKLGVDAEGAIRSLSVCGGVGSLPNNVEYILAPRS